MAEQGKQPTIEELQAQLVELQEKQKENDVKIEALTSEKNKLSEDLNKARELNTKLFLKIPQGENSNTDNSTATEDDSFDKLLDEAIDKYVLKKKQETP